LIDESGLSTRPHKVRTWSPRGHTPIRQHHFNWKSLSVIAGITFYNFYFPLHDQSIKSPQILEFLCHLMRHVAGNLLIIWDGLPAHRSQLTQDFIASTEDRIVAARLPSYAPELNPVEYI
jgi:transposase